MAMRDIRRIILHCTATRGDVSASTIRSWHLDRGWRDIGYHFHVRTDGQIEPGRPLHEVGAHTKGHNKDTIGISYAGGLDADGTPRDTRTEEQTASLVVLVMSLMVTIPEIQSVHGHNEFSPKACPCFDVADDFWHINKEPWRQLGIHEALLTAEKTISW